MRSTKLEVEKRVREIFKLRLGGAEFLDLREYADAAEQSWGVSDTQLRRYIQAADVLCKEYFDPKAEHLLSRHLLQRRQLYAHALGAGDFRTALAVLKDSAELEGLYPGGKLQLSGKDGGPIVFSVEDLLTANEELNQHERSCLPSPGQNGPGT